MLLSRAVEVLSRAVEGCRAAVECVESVEGVEARNLDTYRSWSQEKGCRGCRGCVEFLCRVLCRGVEARAQKHYDLVEGSRTVKRNTLNRA